MNKYDIKDNSTQLITHSYIAATQPAAQAEWGSNYSVEVTDLTPQIKAQAIDDYTRLRDKQCDEEVNSLLAPSEPVTHIMLALFDMYTCVISDDATAEDKATAKANLAAYLNIMGQIQMMRAARDADVAAFTAAQG